MQIAKVELENLGTVNTNQVILENKEGERVFLWFSYQTIVAFQNAYGKRFCVQNQWGPTTGKLLNKIEPNKKDRIEPEEFKKLLSLLLA